MASSTLILVVAAIVVIMQGCGSGNVVRLMHRDSVMSPLYNPMESSEDRQNRLMRISEERMKLISRRRGGADPEGFDATMYPTEGEDLIGIYFVPFSISATHVSQFAAMDTGSNTIWVMCSSCNTCRTTTLSKFKPSNSPTYKTLSCSDQNCIDSTDNSCKKNNDTACTYEIENFNGVNSYGDLATDDFFFFEEHDDSSTGSFEPIQNVVFGCAERVVYKLDTYEPLLNGVFGLGQKSVFARRIEYFSYCFPANEIDDSRLGRLTMGAESVSLEGGASPCEDHEAYYIVRINGFSFDGRDEKIWTTTTSPSPIKAFIDTGSAASYIRRDIYDQLLDTIEFILGPRYSLSYMEKYDRNIYFGDYAAAMKSFPDMVIHFVGNATLVVKSNYLFVKLADDRFALAVLPTDDDLGIIGTNFQIDHNVAFDVRNNRVYIYPTVCDGL